MDLSFNINMARKIELCWFQAKGSTDQVQHFITADVKGEREENR